MKWLVTLVVLLFWPAMAGAEPSEVLGATPAGNNQAGPVTFDDRAPDLDWHWVDGHVLEDGTVIEGFYRVRSRNDFMWIDGKVEGGNWVAPHWQPMKEAAPGMVYARGHRGANGYWAQGYWRPEVREGFTWTETATGDAGTVGGHWVPVETKEDQVWVPGHTTASAGWIDGYWRRKTWPARRWVPGASRYGVYHRGHWAPNARRAGSVWHPGHATASGWKEGRWRRQAKSGSYWRAGTWTDQGWSVGGWVEGRPEAKARRFRVVHVKQMTQRRAQKRTVWKATSGVSAKKRGDRSRKRGKRSRKKKPRKAW